MSAGYYDRKVEARYTEGILSKSRDWQWFIDETTKAFDAPMMAGTSFASFRDAFCGMSRVYGHFSSIADIWPDLQLSFSEQWMEGVRQSCLIRTGAVALPNSYRHLNQLKSEEVAAQICLQSIQETRLRLHVLYATPEIYEAVRSRASDGCVLIDFPEDESSVTLTHVCQLFPLLENTIRELGRHFSIVPFRATMDEFHILRDAPQIIGELIGSVFRETGTIDGTDDLTFVYFAMFSKNGCNVRNACVHGQGYQRGPQLVEAFKLTVLCEYMLLYRLDMVTRAEEHAVSGKDASET